MDLLNMRVLHEKQQMREFVTAEKASGRTIGLVPTMGALHAGHLALIGQADAIADTVVVSVFVNPTQFSPGEDFSEYPRDEAADTGLAASAGADVVFAPHAGEMYPDGFATEVAVGTTLTGVMCGAPGSRNPSHFAGVTTVVAKLLGIVTPDFAVFGEKDAQQLAVVRRMVNDLDIPVEIVGSPTVRDVDGLALSSRNAYLTAEEREIAPLLYESIVGVAGKVEAGENFDFAAFEAIAKLTDAGFTVEYLDLRDAESLAPGRDSSRRTIVAAAARLGDTRLIDNVIIEPSEVSTESESK